MSDRKRSSSKGASTTGTSKPPPDGPVYHCCETEQVELLAQALLREYMHKKQFKATLEQFDEGFPRDDKSVSSRAVMYDLMQLTEAMPQLKAQGADTIMEALCLLRVESREEEDELARLCAAIADAKKRHTSLQQSLVEYEAETARLVENAAATSVTLGAAGEGGNSSTSKKEKKDKKDKKDKKRSGGEGNDAVPAKKEKKDKKDKKSKKTKDVLSIDELLDRDDDLAAARQRQAARHQQRSGSLEPTPLASAEASPSQANRGATKRPEDPLGIPRGLAPAGGAPTTRPLQRRSADIDTTDADDDDDDDDVAGASSDDYDAAVEMVQAEHARAGAPRRAAGRGGNAWGGAFDAEDDERPGQTQPGRAAAAGSSSALPPASSAASPHATPAASSLPALGESLTGELFRALVGEDTIRVPLSFLQQGFYRDEVPGRPPYGLHQREGGPCGIIAAVQARVIQEYHAGPTAAPSSSPERQLRSALCVALARTLALASASRRSGVTIVIPADPHNAAVPTDAVSSIRQQRLYVSGLRTVALATSDERSLAKVFEEDVSGVLTAWTAPAGPGLFCLLLSMILTRGGPAVVSKDADFPTPLIVEHGYCGTEVTNLMLCGKAVSNAHDGVQTAGEARLAGYERELDVGFLSVLEAKGMMRVGDRGKFPAAGPSARGVSAWVLYNESHYSVLFSKQPLQPSSHDARFAAFRSGVASSWDVYYYDQQGQQQEEIRLTVTERPTAPPTTSVTPYVDLALRTIPGWTTVAVKWNGSEPLL